MPRNRRLRGTCIFPRDLKVDIPYIEEFSQFISPSDTLLPTRELFINYSAYLCKKTKDRQTIEAGSSFVRFSRQLRSLASQKNWEYCHTNTRRGYKVQIKMLRTRQVKQSQVPNLYHKINIFQNSSHKYFSRMFISKEKGHGAISNFNIPTGTIVAEYIGQIINATEAFEREHIYSMTRAPCTMFQLSTTCFLDGNHGANGRLLLPGENEGAVLNHSVSYENCKVIKADSATGTLLTGTRLFVITTKDVPKGCELLYDYMDRRRGVPLWLFV